MEKYGVQQQKKPKPSEQIKTGSDAADTKVLCPTCGEVAQWHGVWKCPKCGTAPWEGKK